MSGPTFPTHCHAGIAAVSYLLLDSKKGMDNRDSIGTENLIRPGGLHWTTAGHTLFALPIHGTVEVADLRFDGERFEVPVFPAQHGHTTPYSEPHGSAKVAIFSGLPLLFK